MPQANITPKDMLAGRQQEVHVERTGSWTRHGSNGRFVASKPLDVSATLHVLLLAIDTVQAHLAAGCGSSTSGFADKQEHR